MRPIFTQLLPAALLLFALQVSSGQALNTSFSPATTSAAVGGNVALQLKVTNFTNITSLQLPITYNSAVLQFTSITGITLPGFSAANYNASNGKITLSWFPDLAQYPNGYTTADNSALMTINFKVLADGTSTVNVASTSPGIEVTRNNNVIQVNFANGGSTVTGGAGGSGPLQGFHVIANTITIPQGQSACMPVTVHDFDNIILASYVMHWNTTVLQYQGTQGYNLPDLSASNFNPFGTGNLILSWYDNNLTGVTRPDGATIYQVCFKAVGAPGSTSMVTFDGNGYPVGGGPAEVVNLSNTNVWKSDSGVSDTIFVVTAPPPPNAVTFTADKDTAIVGGDSVCVDVRVKNFVDVVSMQLGMVYDPTKIMYAGIKFPNPNPLGLSLANFNPNVPGEIKFTWFDANAVGVDLPDNTNIFSVCFKGIGSPGATSGFNFTGLPNFAIEIVKEPGGEVIPALVNGHVYLTDVQPPCVKLKTTNISCPGGTNGQIIVEICNQMNASPSYAWAGTNVSGSSSATVSNLVAGTYTVTVTGDGGLTSTATAVITAPLPISNTSSVTNVACSGNTNGAITLNTGGGTSPFTFKWTSSNNPPYSNTTNGASGTTINNLPAATYTVTVTDANMCTATAQAQVGSPLPVTLPANQMTITGVTCFGLKNGAIILGAPSGGTPPYPTYSWAGPNGYTNGNKNPSNLEAGTYTVTITDSKGCTGTATAEVTGPSAALSVTLQAGTVEAETCFGANNGKACVTTAGGTPNYIVAWKYNSPTGPTLANGLCPNSLPHGDFYPVVTDSKGCTAVVANAPVTIGGPTDPIDITPVTVKNLDCANDNGGCITITPTGGNGGFTALWSNSGNTAQICNLDGGTYTVTLTDSKGCTATFDPITVTEPQPISFLAADTVVVKQNGATPGSITINAVQGGTGPFTFNWSGPSINAGNQNNQSQPGLNYGNYSLTVTDSKGCTKVFAFYVGTNNVLPLTTATTDAACNTDGCIHVTMHAAAAAQGPFLVTWNPGGGTMVPDDLAFSICNLKAGAYSVTIADALGNTYTLPVNMTTVAQKEKALVGSNSSNPFAETKNGMIALQNSFGLNLSYVWNTSDTTSSLTGLDHGTYTVTVTNEDSGCTSTLTFTLVRQYPPFQCAAVSITPATCLNSANGAISVNVLGANDPYTFQWTSGSGTFTSNSKDIANLPPDTYVLVVIDESSVAHQCPAMMVNPLSNLLVTNVNELSNYNGYQVSSTQVCDGSASVVYSGNNGAVSILWSNGGTGVTNNSLCGGTYTVTVTDNLGCTSEWTDELTVAEALAALYEVPADYNGYDLPCSDACDAVAKVIVAGGVPPYTVTWPSGQTDVVPVATGFSQANQLCGGNYAVTITDKNGSVNGVKTVLNVIVTAPDSLVIEFAEIVPQTLTSCDGEVIASIPDGYGDATYVWSSAFGKNGEGERAEILCAGDLVHFVVETENGCTGTGDYRVPFPIDECLKVRPVLTPAQQDGNNDYTLIACIEQYPDNTFEVYNRWGQLVFETEGYDNASNRWEGLTGSGQLLPEGAYFYVLKYKDDDGNELIAKGYINLLR